LEQENDTIKAHYCNTRICHICNRIRTAKMMNGYMPQFGENMQFVTLTLPNVNAVDLKYTCDYITKQASDLIRNLREKKGIKVNGIRKLEITYNNKQDTFHPHLHMIVDKYGNEIVDLWLKRIPEANIQAQDCRLADKNSLNELFKYTTKIIGHKPGEYVVYVNALDTIMQALSKKRCFQPFGNIHKVKEDIVELEKQVYDNIPSYDFMVWKWDDCDWVNKNRNTLTGYISPDVDFSYK